MTTFLATYDRTTKVISGLVCALLLGIAFTTRSPLAGGVAALTLVLAWAWSPRGYALRGEMLIVRRLIGNVSIPLAGIRQVRPAAAEDLRGAMRLWGSGGMFGYYGLFRTTNLGACTWYATNRSRMVIVVATDKTVLLSPDDTDGFVVALRSAAPQIGPDAQLPVAQPAVSRAVSLRRIAIIAAAVALSLAMVGLVMSYSPGAPAYTLNATSLAIHDRFYPVKLQAAEVDLIAMRLVDVTGTSAWRPVVRTNGFDNWRYRSGWFRCANGQSVRLYRAAAVRLVLLPPKGPGTPVLLEVPDPAGFIDKVRQAWGPR